MSDKEPKTSITSKSEQGAKYFCPTIGDGKVVVAKNVKEAAKKAKVKE